MEQRRFQYRLACSYEGSDNEIKDLDVEVLNKDVWEKLDLSILTPGFLVFCYGILSCQHLYLRINAKERGLTLKSMTGSIDVTTTGDWIIQKRHIQFDVVLASGTPSNDDVNYIVERMHHCPSTINLRDAPDAETRVNFV